jgi:glycine cleavage system pyridoxal-binding protein P
MLDFLKFDSMDSFIAECVPTAIRIDSKIVSESGDKAILALSEQELLVRARELGSKNKVFRSFIGMGYHQAVRPVITSSLSHTRSEGYHLQILDCRTETFFFDRFNATGRSSSYPKKRT